MEDIQVVKHVCMFIGATAERESRFLYPNPSWNVNAVKLLDMLHEKTGLSKELLDSWCREGQAEFFAHLRK